MFFSQYFSFPCQYHSTSASYSFIHLPPTLYNVFFPVLQFPLSVSFHQCSILIHSSTTDAVQCFSPSTSVSPVSIIPPMLHTHSFTYHWRCIIFFSQYSSFPCQYYSSIAAHSFIHLPQMLLQTQQLSPSLNNTLKENDMNLVTNFPFIWTFQTSTFARRHCPLLNTQLLLLKLMMTTRERGLWNIRHSFCVVTKTHPVLAVRRSLQIFLRSPSCGCVPDWSLTDRLVSKTSVQLILSFRSFCHDVVANQ
jgi:hypothetical protein